MRRQPDEPRFGCRRSLVRCCLHGLCVDSAFASRRSGRFKQFVARVIVFTAVLYLPAQAQLTPAQQEELAAYFGFDEMEMYKLDPDISHLRVADLNGDGLNDLIVVNNYKSKIEVLLQRREKPDDSLVMPSAEVNELFGHWRFERKNVPINYRVSTLAVADVTGDSAPDIVFLGEPLELVVLKNLGDGQFSAPIVQRVRDGIARKRSLATGDLNGDGRTDVAVLGEKDVLYFYQKPGGGLQRPVYQAHATTQPYTIDIADVNGDGRQDVIIVTGGSDYHAHIRFQTPQGDLGPQQRVKLPRIRTWEFLSCLGRKQADLIAVEDISGRLRRWQIERTTEMGGAEDWLTWYFPYPASENTTNRPVALGDVTGDGRVDLVAADVKAAQILLYEQVPDGGLASPLKFGGQVNMRDLRVHDLDGDGRCEVLVASADEKAIGVSRWVHGRLTFPKPLPTVAEPQVFDLVTIGTGPDHWFVYVTKEEGEYFLSAPQLRCTADGDALDCKVEREFDKIKIEDYPTAPSALRLVDVNQDGRVDALVFAPYEPLVTFLQAADGSFERLKGGSSQEGLVKHATIEGFHVSDLTADGRPEIVLAQRSFARALRVNQHKQWVVVDQFNAPTAAAEITGVTTVPRASGGPSVALYDKRNSELHWLQPRQDGTYESQLSLPIGTFELKLMTTTIISGADGGDILLSDARKFAVLQPDRPALQAIELAAYESKIKDAYLRRPAVGDLNHDGRTDVVIADGKESHLEVLTFGPTEQLVLATRFKVFDTKQFRQAEQESQEPREVVIDDLNGDGHDDIAIIVHDRVIIYPTE